MCGPQFIAPVLTSLAGMGMQMFASRNQYKSQADANKYQRQLLSQGSRGYDQAQRVADQQIQGQLGPLSPQETTARLNEQAGQIGGSINQSVLDANLAFGDDYLRTPGKSSDSYERAYAGRIADVNERTAQFAKLMGQTQAPGYINLQNSDAFSRANEQIGMAQSSAGNQAQIYQNAAGLVQPDYNPLNGIMAGAGGALTSHGLGQVFAGAAGGGAAPWSSAPWGGAGKQVPPTAWKQQPWGTASLPKPPQF